MSYPDDANFTSTANLKIWAQVPDSIRDADLLALINRASGAVLRYINRPSFFSAAISETRNGLGPYKTRLSFLVRPVTAVTNVVINGITIPVSPDGIVSGYLFDQRCLYLVGYEFPYGYQNVVISYTGGYAVNSPEAGVVEQATLVICNAWWRKRDHEDRVSGSTPQGGSNAWQQTWIPPAAETLLMNLCKKVPVQQ